MQEIRKAAPPSDYIEQFYIWWHGGAKMYPGNQWNKPLAEDELKVLYYPLREVAYLYDFISTWALIKVNSFKCEGYYDREASYRATDMPVSQALRPLVHWITLLQTLAFFVFLWYAIPYVFWASIDLVFG